jgi:hypothetical protein
MILAIDPSKKCTGFIIADHDGEVVDFATFEFKKDDKMKATAEKMHFQSSYTRILKSIIKVWRIDTVLCEFPPGSQSAVAAWYLAMVTQCITTVTLTLLDKEPLLVTPGDAKAAVLDDRNASKMLAREFCAGRLEPSC